MIVIFQAIAVIGDQPTPHHDFVLVDVRVGCDLDMGKLQVLHNALSRGVLDAKHSFVADVLAVVGGVCS